MKIIDSKVKAVIVLFMAIFVSFSLIEYDISSLKTKYFFNYLAVFLMEFPILLGFLGILMVMIITNMHANETTKKLGYGPIKWDIYRITGFSWLWEEKYYEKDEYKNEVSRWKKEFDNIKKNYIFYYDLAYSLILIGISILVFSKISCSKELVGYDFFKSICSLFKVI
jgi:hypothetical protein